MREEEERVNTLEDLGEQAKGCTLCPLSQSRTQVVFGAGNHRARIMFVGEAPGYHEDLKGEPFVGSAGRLLSELLENIGMKRTDVYIANVIKCRPPGNRNPLPEEIESCKPYLLKQIELIKPKIVCTLGNFSTQLLLKKKVGVSKLRGQSFQVDGYVVVPMYHPAAALHQGGLLVSLKEDFSYLKTLLEAGIEPTRVSEQMTLF
ncbi:MAG: uracil-DNA glycosylase [Candidatus Tectomicrobia bacterium]|uniref:Type-4 uracil-DNA glycosylase n=1 Tax=Tectimicrobiota bacterium TaxID=2528274 RepID=A0A932M038_UNCTE|nr:uracil-DNA glycosylase [Candidatus Tectomicrobia bacterium]